MPGALLSDASTVFESVWTNTSDEKIETDALKRIVECPNAIDKKR